MFNKIKVLLAQRHLSFLELSDYVGMTHQGLRHSLKTGKISFEAIQRIAEFLSVGTEYLTSEESTNNQDGVGPKQIESIGKLKEKILSQQEIIDFLKGKANELYDNYWKFLLSLDNKDAKRLYKNSKLHEFEIQLILVLQEIFALTAQSQEERARHQKLIQLLKGGRVSYSEKAIVVMGSTEAIGSIINAPGKKIARIIEDIPENEKTPERLIKSLMEEGDLYSKKETTSIGNPKIVSSIVHTPRKKTTHTVKDLPEKTQKKK